MGRLICTTLQVARNHGGIKGHTFNALIRAISGVSVDRALRLLGLMRAMGLKPSVTTVLDLVDACARDNNAQVSCATIFEGGGGGGGGCTDGHVCFLMLRLLVPGLLE